VITAEQLEVLKKYLQPAAPKIAPAADISASDAQFDKWIQNAGATPDVSPAPNGIAFIPDYKTWRATMWPSYARTNTQHEYPAGSTLSLVTWTQREDSRWFGARIPDGVKAVEFVFVGATAGARPSYSYQEFEGTPLKKLSSEEGPTPSGRAAYLLSQRAAVMP
jgi:hypothetical protein